MPRLNQCSSCSRELLLSDEFFCCARCGAAIHRACRLETRELCPKCGNPVAPVPYYLPETSGWTIALAVIGGVAALFFLIATLVLADIPFGKNAPGTAGLAFYFVFLPFLAGGFIFAACFLVVWFLRREARKPRRLNP